MTYKPTESTQKQNNPVECGPGTTQTRLILLMKLTQSYIRIALFVLCLLSLTACIYHPDVQQGNQITNAQTQRLHKNMTEKEIYAVLGKPILANPYGDKNRIVYVYTFQHTHKSMITKRLFIELKHNRLTHFWTQDNKKLH